MAVRPGFVPAALIRAGAILLGAAFVAFAAQNFAQAGFILGLEPLPASLPGRPVWEVLNSLILLVAGGWIIARRLRGKSACVPALILGVLLVLWMVLLQVRVIVGDPANGAWWGVLCETIAIASGTWILAGVDADMKRAWPRRAIRLGRIGFGVSLLGFAAFHVKYAAYIIAVLPPWLPWHAFWCYFTCAAFVAGAVSILTGVLAPWGAFWTGVMPLCWVFMLHLPRVLQATRAEPYRTEICRDEISSTIVALAVGAAAWILAESSAPRRMDM